MSQITKYNQSTESADGLGAAGRLEKQGKEITIAAYVYVFIVKKSKDHIKNSKYYETAYLKKGGPCWHFIAHLGAKAYKYTHLRHEESKGHFTAGLGRLF